MRNQTPKISDQLNEALAEKIRQASGKPVGKTLVEAASPEGRVSVVVEDADRLGVLAGPITAQREGGGKPGCIGVQAAEAVRRLNYLQEPLAVIESEDRRSRAILRSEAPRPTGGGREYNEAVLDDGSISIRRFRTDSAGRRRATPSNLSRETLGRLADDLLGILDKD